VEQGVGVALDESNEAMLDPLIKVVAKVEDMIETQVGEGGHVYMKEKEKTKR